jgi:5-carboxymethyl-2-hydroxymuconate isomerase
MPHLRIEVTKNIVLPAGTSFLKTFTEKLSECATFDLPRIKSRLITLDNYCVGNQVKEFVYVHVAILPGRSTSLKLACQQHLLEYFKAELDTVNPDIDIHISVDVIELGEYAYFQQQVTETV